MSKHPNNIDLVKLIIKSVLGSLSDEENHDFEEWLTDPLNKAFYFKILNNENVERKFQMFDSLDKDDSYSKLLKRIKEKELTEKQKSSFFLKNIYKYAAIFIVLLTVGYSVFYFSAEQEQLKPVMSVVEDLKPGYNQATLVLEDGSEIELEGNSFTKKQIRSNIQNSNNTLTYKSEIEQGNSNIAEKVSMNTLHVPVGGLYKLVLPDGTKVWLNSSSSLKYPVSFSSNKRIVELHGEAYFEVQKDKKAFIVKTRTRDVSVLGTAFNISSYDDDTFFAATLSEGKIKLTHEHHMEVFMEPGEQALINNSSLNIVEVEKVDPRVYSAWKDGTFFFENESLEDILHKVGRWYNFKSDFTDTDLKKITFTGLVSKEFPVKRLLEMISKSTNVKYEIIQNKTNNENVIIISRRE